MRLLRRGGVLLLLVTTLGLVSVAGSGASAAPRATAGQAISASRCASNRGAGTIKFLSPFYDDASAGIIDVYNALQLGYFKALCLNVTFNADTTSTTYSEVSTGVGTITGEGSAADALLQMAGGDRFTAISTFGDASDYVLLTRTSIQKLTQLQGKTLAFHYPVLPVVLSEMLKRAGVDAAKVHIVADTTYTPSLVIHGPYTALQAYGTNEPLELKAEGYAKDFRVWTPAQFGVKGTFNVQVVNNTFLKAHPTAVADFLRAELHAFDYCAAHGAVCVANIAKAAPKGYDVAHANAEWALEVKLATGNTLPGKGVGVQSRAEWTPELNALVAAKLVKTAPSLASVENTSIAASLYNKTHLIWP